MDGKDDFEEWRKALEEAVKAAQEKEKSEGIKKMGTIGLLLEIWFLLIGQRRIRPGMTLHMVGDLHCH